MTPDQLREFLQAVAQGRVAVDDAVERLGGTSFADLDGVTLDLGRRARTGGPEVVYGEGKDAAQLEAVVTLHLERGTPLLVSRVRPEHGELLRRLLPGGTLHERPRVFVWHPSRDPSPVEPDPGMVVVSAGASDAAVAEETSLVAAFVRGRPPVMVRDCGVAGLHRLLAHLPTLRRARVVVAVAGMDGVLPTAVAGLVGAPVVAVPTSVGYGPGGGGLTPLLTMLSSCAPGLVVVNVDNGVGAAFAACRILDASSGEEAS